MRTTPVRIGLVAAAMVLSLGVPTAQARILEARATSGCVRHPAASLPSRALERDTVRAPRYTYDDCMDGFTPDQAVRMQEAWLAYRAPSPSESS